MREFAVRTIHRPPPLGKSQYLINLIGQQAMHRTASRAVINKRPALTAPGSPTVDPVIADTPQRGRPTMSQARRGGVVNSVQDQLFGCCGDSRRDYAVEPQPAFPRKIANSIAWAFTASVK